MVHRLIKNTSTSCGYTAICRPGTAVRGSLPDRPQQPKPSTEGVRDDRRHEWINHNILNRQPIRNVDRSGLTIVSGPMTWNRRERKYQYRFGRRDRSSPEGEDDGQSPTDTVSSRSTDRPTRLSRRARSPTVRHRLRWARRYSLAPLGFHPRRTLAPSRPGVVPGCANSRSCRYDNNVVREPRGCDSNRCVLFIR